MSTAAIQILDILKEAKISETEAIAIVKSIEVAIEKEREEIKTAYITKEGQNDVINRLIQIESKIETTMATKEDIHIIRNEMKDMKFDMLKWIIILVTLNTVVIISAVLSIGKFLLGK